MSRKVTEVKLAIFICFHILPIELIPASSATSPRRAIIQTHAKGSRVAASRDRSSMHVNSVGGCHCCCTPVSASTPCWPLHKQCVMTQILSGSIHDLVRDNSCSVIAEGVRCNCSDATLSSGIQAQCSCRADRACTIFSTVSLYGPSHLLQRPVEAWCHVTGSRHSMLACANMYRRCQRHGSCSLCNHIVISLY